MGVSRQEAKELIDGYFETGMMGMQHGQGAWIGDGKDIHYGSAPYVRKEFKTGKKVKSARAYIAAAGLYRCV